jgi:signal transduction histidine kinase
VTLHNQAVISNQVQQDERIAKEVRARLKRTKIQSAALVPLTIKEEVIGTLVTLGKLGGKGEFDQSDLDLLIAFANQAAIAIENARLYEQSQQLAVVEERQRLARDLHDSVTQALYGMTLYGEAMARQLAAGEAEQAKQQLDELQVTAQEALREMRLLIFQLRPPALEEEGLTTVLRSRLEAVEARAGLMTELNVGEEVRLPQEVEEGLYRIAQEALNNALKHAMADKVVLNLFYREGRIILEVIDDGIGFDLESGLEYGGLGLDGMQERAAKLGGGLIVETSPGTGTKVRVEVPR